MRLLRARLSTLLVLVFPALFAALTYLQAQTPAGGAAPAIDSGKVYQACTGHWAGTLEYRDFQSDKRVALPTNLEAAAKADGSGLQLSYTYDDGPGKIVRESSTLSIDAAKRTLTMASDGGKSREQLSIAGFDIVARTQRLTLSFSGTGEENNKPVEVRSTLSCGPNTFTLLRETRLPGQDFKFRDQYSFTRWPIQSH
jgi:hypothetical protein